MSELETIREVNAHLPFAHPIAPGFVWSPSERYVTLEAGTYRDHDRRRRILDRMTRRAHKHGHYENDF